MQAVFDAYQGLIESTGVAGLDELRKQISRDKNRLLESGSIALTAAECLQLENAINE